MFKFSRHMIVSFFLVTAITLIVAVSVFPLFSFGMTMNDDGSMSGCPFMAAAGICTMNIFEHISMWHSMFGPVPEQSGLLVWLSLVLALSSFVLWRLVFKDPPILILAAERYKAATFPSNLKDAFSNGILHSKAY